MKKNKKQFTWKGEKDRALTLIRPCSCGCEDGKGIGYFTGSNSLGEGFTIWINEEKVFQALIENFRNLKRKKIKIVLDN